VTKAELAEFLTTVDPVSLSGEETALLQAFSDLFACQVRLRAKIRSGINLDVTRNLTVRYSRKFGSSNVNENSAIERIGIIGVAHDDLEAREDIGLYANDTTWVFHASRPDLVEQAVAVEGRFEHEEQPEHFWYYTTLDPVTLIDGFYVTDSGDEADDMYVFDDHETVRIAPPIGLGPKLIRMYVVSRDYRPEWRMYHATPGATLQHMDVLFE